MESLVEQTLYFMAQKGWKQSDECFFNALVSFLGKTLNVDYVLVSELQDDQMTAKTVAVFAMGTIMPNFSYPLQGTPCENVMGKQLCYFPRNIKEQFPKDQFLLEMDVQSYLGIPLWDSNGQSLGLIAILGRNTWAESWAKAETILQLLALRCAHELEHRQTTRALKHSEIRYRELFEKSVLGMGVVNLDGTFRHTNPALQEMLGYSEAELLTKSLTDLSHPEDLELGEEDFAQVRSGKKEWVRIEKRFIRKNGRSMDALVSLQFVLDESRIPVYTLAQILDISDRCEAERMQAKIDKKIRQNQKLEAIGTLAGGIAHEFNNVLAAIIGFGDLLEDQLAHGSEEREYSQEILKAANRAKRLVNQILTFSRKTVEAAHPVQVHLIVNEAFKLLRNTIPSTIKMNLFLEKEGTIVNADPTHIHQIMMDLCTNAYQAIPETGQIVVRLEATKGDDAFRQRHPELEHSHYCQLTVSDTGMGMTEETLSKVFEPFFSTKSVELGTGMGMSVVHGIVSGYGGAIEIDSQVGQGTEVRVFLPALMPDSTSHEPNNETEKGTGERILVVDDEQALGRLATQVLTRLGYEVTCFQSSLEALEHFKAQPNKYDLVYTDLSMPGLSGSQLTRKMLNIRPDLAVVMCTGFGKIMDEQRILDLGAKALLIKPVRKKQLAETIRNALEKVSTE